MAITLEQIKQLREETNLPIVDCKKALEEAKGNLEEARKLLESRGVQIAEKKQTREVGEGLIETYLHPNGKVGALLDVRCETDFVAKSQDFRNLCHELALQVASMNPDTVEELEKQPYIRDPAKTVKDIITNAVAKLGENIIVKRFSRFEI
ncbi:MAG: translation elongation factor Ts [Candidatus Wildermuthbacteria bacterium RIFCSPHIGHO2_02_FULL_48_16]|uniref:Elongation factor Ts n=2 Tax=Candidatus Wildermuthiibacteriota TaxID=1817923 RepID=A0A1G2R938_9BACT|nr:MAG: translation elongation factor Ts [Candidatus Wildermuthbacteria bacterium RIFCSPHIGHO2_02_FULL_48_16]OHA73891.1 MAG: translation elongation factor Ts [Candidatus Wildermuthbacteria bacterium RIFCSPLOWO2_01_FULL_48_16]